VGVVEKIVVVAVVVVMLVVVMAVAGVVVVMVVVMVEVAVMVVVGCVCVCVCVYVCECVCREGGGGLTSSYTRQTMRLAHCAQMFTDARVQMQRHDGKAYNSLNVLWRADTHSLHSFDDSTLVLMRDCWKPRDLQRMRVGVAAVTTTITTTTTTAAAAAAAIVVVVVVVVIDNACRWQVTVVVKVDAIQPIQPTCLRPLPYSVARGA
jgi:hypothetical protein